jgi:hypothetical protein
MPEWLGVFIFLENECGAQAPSPAFLLCLKFLEVKSMNAAKTQRPIANY